jgi:hypothetical protein
VTHEQRVTGLDSGMNNEVEALAVFDDGTGSALSPPTEVLLPFDDGTGPALFAGGTFTIPGNRIAKWQCVKP